MTESGTTCFYCGREVDPTDRAAYRRVAGWERKAVASSRKSGSDIVLREPSGEYAHGECVATIQAGLSIGQASLI